MGTSSQYLDELLKLPAEGRSQAAMPGSRWRESRTPSTTRRQGRLLPPSLRKLSERFEREMRDASNADFDRARERLDVLSPWYAPPTDRSDSMT